jgi:hypothetical protein
LNFDKDMKKVQKWIISSFNDPLSKILLNKSYLTRIQLETLLIDGLAEHILDRKIGYEEKSKMRLSVKGVSRGAFNRTLYQARKNIMGAIYTILLLGYLGILETPSLDPFIEASNRLATYSNAYRRMYKEENLKLINKNKIKSLSILREDLELTLKNISLTKKGSKDVT